MIKYPYEETWVKASVASYTSACTVIVYKYVRTHTSLSDTTHAVDP